MKGKVFKQKNEKNFYYIIMAYFMRSMISESLAGNIGFFSILSAINYCYKLIQNTQNQALSMNKIIN